MLDRWVAQGACAPFCEVRRCSTPAPLRCTSAGPPSVLLAYRAAMLVLALATGLLQALSVGPMVFAYFTGTRRQGGGRRPAWLGKTLLSPPRLSAPP